MSPSSMECHVLLEWSLTSNILIYFTRFIFADDVIYVRPNHNGN